MALESSFGFKGSVGVPRAPNPPAIPHFLWFPHLRIAYTPVPRPSRLRQAASSNRNRWVSKWVIRVQYGQKIDFAQK